MSEAVGLRLEAFRWDGNDRIAAASRRDYSHGMRDHTKLRAFELADQLALSVYQVTPGFPTNERFGLTNQIRRAAVSTASNIVEGCARNTESEYLRFLDIAFGSARELEYQLSLAIRLGFVSEDKSESIASLAEEASKVLGGLIRALRAIPSV